MNAPLEILFFPYNIKYSNVAGNKFSMFSILLQESISKILICDSLTDAMSVKKRRCDKDKINSGSCSIPSRCFNLPHPMRSVSIPESSNCAMLSLYQLLTASVLRDKQPEAPLKFNDDLEKRNSNRFSFEISTHQLVYGSVSS